MGLASPPPLPTDEFLHELSELRQCAIENLRDGKYGVPRFLANPDSTEAERRPEIIFLLQLGVYPEFRETHFLSRQIQRIDDVDLVYRIGEQIFDEAKHTKLLVDQLLTWGADPLPFWKEPIYHWSAAFDFMDKQTHPAEYFVGSNFIGEGLFLASLMAPMAKHDPETFNVYVEHIMPDEPRHIKIGQDIVARYCDTYDMQQRVLYVARTVAKQYCLGYAAAMRYAATAQAGKSPAELRDSEPMFDPPEVLS